MRILCSRDEMRRNGDEDFAGGFVEVLRRAGEAGQVVQAGKPGNGAQLGAVDVRKQQRALPRWHGHGGGKLPVVEHGDAV